MNSFKKPEKKSLDRISEEELIEKVFNHFGLKDPLTKRFIDACFVAAQVFDLKQQRYGPQNIAEFGEVGVMIRVRDKIARLINMWRSGIEPQDETKDDTWGDIATYSLIALLCRWGKWPGVEPAKQEK